VSRSRPTLAGACLVTTTTVVLCILCSPAVLADGPTWTDLRGEAPAEGELMKLGADVLETAGPPSGPPLQGQPLQDRTTVLAATLRCPVCQSQSIQDSTSEAARNMRSQVQAMLAAGYDEDQVFVYFEHSYGEFIRLMPRAEGFNLLVWALPVGALLVGLVGVGVVVRRSMGAPDAPKDGGSGQQEADPGAGEPVDTPTDPSLQPWLDRVRQEIAENDR